MNWERKPKRTITFTNRDGGYAGKAQIREIGKRGNRHFNKRRPNGPVCTDCGAPWQPVCSSFTCPGSKVPRAMIRAEKQDAGTKRFPGHPALEPRRQGGGSRERQHATHADRNRVRRTVNELQPGARQRRPSVMDGKLKALEAKYGGRHERSRAA